MDTQTLVTPPAVPEAHSAESCRPTADLMSMVGDRWTALVLGRLAHERLRFKVLQREIPGVSQRMLTVTLRQLERDGLLIRTVYPTVPPRVEYELSPLGRALRIVLEPVAAWVQANRPEIEASRAHFDAAAETARLDR